MDLLEDKDKYIGVHTCIKRTIEKFHKRIWKITTFRFKQKRCNEFKYSQKTCTINNAITKFSSKWCVES